MGYDMAGRYFSPSDCRWMMPRLRKCSTRNGLESIDECFTRLLILGRFVNRGALIETSKNPYSNGCIRFYLKRPD